MVDREPRSEYPGKHSISFVGPSASDINSFDYIVRAGSDRKGGIGNPIEIARVILPEEFPASEVSANFIPDKWENSPYGREDVPHWTVGYDIPIRAPLREPISFDKDMAKRILASLWSNACRGIYRELPNGSHQIVIPGGKLITLSSSTYPQTYDHTPDEKTTAVLDLGIVNPEAGREFLSGLREGSREDWQKESLDKQIAKLNDSSINTLRFNLSSNYLFSSGSSMGDNRSLEGAMDRRFGMAYGDRRLDYGPYSQYFGVYPAQVLPYFENVEFLLEAFFESLGKKTLPPTPVPVGIPVHSEA